MMKRAILAAAALGAVVAAPASAVTLVSAFGNGTTFNQTTFAGYDTKYVFDFSTNNQLQNAGFSTADSVAPVDIVSGTVFQQYTAPTGSQGNRYVAVRGGGTFQAENATEGFDLISFFLGTVDTFNSVTILDINGNAIQSFSGAALAGSATPNGTQARRVTFTRQAGEAAFGGLQISSTSNAAEFDNLIFAAAIPEPSTWALMLAGFGMVGMAMRSRRRRTSVVFG